MIVKDIPPIRILLSVYKLAKTSLPEYPSSRGRKGYKFATRIAVVAFQVLYNLSLEKAEKELEKTGLYRRLGAKKAPDHTTICKWKKEYAKTVRSLMKEAFYRISQFMRIDKLTAVADGSGFKDHKYSLYYKDRLEKLKKKQRREKKKDRGKSGKRGSKRKKKRRKRRTFTRVVVTYALEIDAIFEITATPSSVGEKTAFMDGHLNDMVGSKLFYRFIADKLYDSEDLITALERGGVEPCIPARGGRMKPKGGARARADENYRRLREEEGNLRSLVESSFSSLKALYVDYVRSRKHRGKEMEIVMLGLFYNVARLCALNLV